MVRRAHDAVTISAAITYYKHRQVVKTDVVSYLLEAAKDSERSNAVTNYPKASGCHASSHADHALFSNASIDVFFGQLFLQIFKSIITKITSNENKIVVLF